MKRAKVTTETYKPSVIEKFTGASRQGAEEKQQEPVVTGQAAPDSEEQQKGGRNFKPTSIYFHPSQLRKLDDIAYAYNVRTGKRINRNDILRYLVDQCRVEDLLQDGGVL